MSVLNIVIRANTTWDATPDGKGRTYELWMEEQCYGRHLSQQEVVEEIDAATRGME